MWSPMLDARIEGWRDAVHTIRGAAAGIGAGALAAVCAEAEAAEKAWRPRAGSGQDALDDGPGRRRGLAARADAEVA